MKFVFLFLVLSISLGACKRSQTADPDALVSVGGRTLDRSAVNALIPKGVSPEDSLLLAENIVKKWVKDMLVYDMALRNLGNDKEEVDKLVEEYRRSLIRYRYQERLVEEKLKAEILESDKLNYYEENPGQFVLDRGLIKGLFLKIPIDAPGLADVKKWYKSTDVASLEKIEKYSVQNATIYEYFYDKWVDFDEVMGNIPVHVADPNAFLKANKQVEASDSSYCYLLNIREYLPAGATEPYDYASPHIIEILVNQRKVAFLRNFEDELYNDAIRDGDVVFHAEP